MRSHLGTIITTKPSLISVPLEDAGTLEPPASLELPTLSLSQNFKLWISSLPGVFYLHFSSIPPCYLPISIMFWLMFLCRHSPPFPTPGPWPMTWQCLPFRIPDEPTVWQALETHQPLAISLFHHLYKRRQWQCFPHRAVGRVKQGNPRHAGGRTPGAEQWLAAGGGWSSVGRALTLLSGSNLPSASCPSVPSATPSSISLSPLPAGSYP